MTKGSIVMIDLFLWGLGYPQEAGFMKTVLMKQS